MKAATRTVVAELRALADSSRLPGMARVGIEVGHAIGLSIPHCRTLARQHRGDHELALELWTTGIHEARIVAGMVDDPLEVTERQKEIWVRDFDSWDLCDQVCGNLFTATSRSFDNARAWVRRPEEFVRRAGFVIVAGHAARNGAAESSRSDDFWLAWIPEIERAATDDRNYVKKAVNWSLRQIGKRNRNLNAAAIQACDRLLMTDDRSARWVARDARRELVRGDIQARLIGRGSDEPGSSS